MRREMQSRAGMTIVAVLVGLTAVGLAAGADSRPNFSGEWKMNAAKSNFGPMPAPESRTDKIDHKDPSLKLTSTFTTPQGERTREWSCTTDGKECENAMGQVSFKSSTKWDGGNLVVDSKGSFSNNEVQIKEKWSLSEDGKTLTIERHLSSSMGEGDQKIVLEKH